jgi:CDP-diacylglycerol--glycerol-3-phosphate 3-phosphatidyltransferase
MTYTRGIGIVFGKVIHWIVRGLALSRIHPNVLTAFGLIINVGAAALLAVGQFHWAGVVIIGAGLFDMVDGRVARETNRVTRFGGFFDSVLDRYSDLALLVGLLVWYGSINRFGYVVLTAIVMTGSVMVSYTRARAENTIPQCKVGFMERPERGDRGARERDRDRAHDFHVPGSQAPGRSATAAGGFKNGSARGLMAKYALPYDRASLDGCF